MAMQYCMSCMRRYPKGEAVCTCGNRHGFEQQPTHALRCGSILNGKYLIGKVIGQGGFGITYVAMDLVLNRKVAIKEYYPSAGGTVSRNPHSGELQWFGEAAAMERGYDSFLKEARKMAKLDEIPGIVGVRELLQINRTAYIVMNFIDGLTLKEKAEREGTMSFRSCARLLLPVMEALEQAHRYGIIHRDISPDNIMLDSRGTPWLLDMGAAKELDILPANGQYSQSTQLVVKHGFSPPEQYASSNQIGTWTDVYAMCATIYYCVTGKLPPMATDRMFRDTLELRPPLKPSEFALLRRGMELNPRTRIANMRDLRAMVQQELGGMSAEYHPSQKTVPSRESNPRSVQVPQSANRNPSQSVRVPSRNTQGNTGGSGGWMLLAGIIAGIVFMAVILSVGQSSKPATPVIQRSPIPTIGKLELPNATTTEATRPPETTKPEKRISWVTGSWESLTTNINGDQAHAFKFDTPLVRCKEMTVNMMIEMNAGARCKNWTLWGRSGGSYFQIGTIYLADGNGSTSQTFTFYTPTNVEAIAIRPTVSGSYSWTQSISVTDALVE